MPDPLSEVKSRLIDTIYAPRVPAAASDPFDALSLHATVSNELWWMHATPLRSVKWPAEAATHEALADDMNRARWHFARRFLWSADNCG
jgi:hypothetical protein